MSKLRYGQIEYKIINDKITVAFLRRSSSVLYEVEKCCSGKTNDLVQCISRWPAMIDLDIPSFFKGIAICSDGEVFSEVDGKELARKKAMFKYHEAMRKKYGQILRMMEIAYPEIERLYNEHSDMAAKLYLEHKNYCDNKSFE